MGDNSPAKKKRVALEDSDELKNGSSAVQEIDEGLYSRQLYAIGHEAMRKMAACDVFISGLGGLGVEIAKNVILSGVKSVTLHDDTQCTIADLTSQFYLTESDIGKNRADVSLPQLSDLNRYVPTKSYSGQLTNDFIKKFRVVVLTNSSPEERLRISEITHANNIALIIADTRGLFAQVFCDFGDSFTTVNTDGKEPTSARITNIARLANTIVVTTGENENHDLEDGDYVTFSQIQGMAELNGCQPKKITVLGHNRFAIDDTSISSEYTSGGIFTQVKMSKLIHFKPLFEALQNPEFLIADFAKCDRPPQLHLAFATLHKFVDRYGALPRPWNKADARKFIFLADSLNTVGTKLDASLLETFAKIARGSLGPLNATIGGIVGQEVFKAGSGQLSPIYQWLYFDALECLPTDLTEIDEEDCQATGSRYDGQTAIFGKTYQKKLGALRYFVVGAGAIGCELLKNFAMIGVGAGTSGQITVTDMDLVEKNRHFLFRPADVLRSKSGTAASAVRRMNPAMNVVSQENRVGPETEHLYEDAFFKTLDGVASTVDDLQASLYVLDRLCVYYRKPLVSTFTLGVRGCTHVVIPDLSESIVSWPYSLTNTVELCTLDDLPYDYEHIIQWARDRFDCLFRQPVEIAVQYLNDPEFVDRIEKDSGYKPVQVLTSIKLVLVDQRPRSFQDCVAWARCYWQEQFNHQIRQLVVNFPADHLTTSGLPFWLGPKQCPVPLEFSADEPEHLDFVVAAANLKAEVYGIPQVRDRESIRRLVLQVSVPEFVPRGGVRVAMPDSEHPLNIADNVEEHRYEQLKAEIPRREHFSELHIKPLDFQTSNFHTDFIVASSNLRAGNYKQAPTPRFMYAHYHNKIIPAIATTSSLVAGLACLELLKVVRGHQSLEPFKNSLVNLALPYFNFSEPIAAPKANYDGTKLTFWDHLVVRGDMTLSDFIRYFEEKFNMDVISVGHGRFSLYSFNMDDEEYWIREGMAMSRVWERASQKQLHPRVRSLELLVECFDANHLQVQIPLVRLTLWMRREGPR